MIAAWINDGPVQTTFMNWSFTCFVNLIEFNNQIDTEMLCFFVFNKVLFFNFSINEVVVH